MTKIYCVMRGPPELIVLGDQQNRWLQLMEQEVIDKMTAIYDKVYFELFQWEIGKDYVDDAIQDAQSVVQNIKQI